jgi:hypothetical protein
MNMRDNIIQQIDELSYKAELLEAEYGHTFGYMLMSGAEQAYWDYQNEVKFLLQELQTLEDSERQGRDDKRDPYGAW